MSRVAFVVALLALGACAAVLPRSAKSEFYVLSAAEPGRAASAPVGAPAVLVGAVTLPQYLDRRELVTRLASNQLRVEDLELWAEPLRESVPRTIEHDLETLVGEGTVQRLPWTGAAPPAAVVTVEIRRFEKTARRTVDLAASWTIADGRSGDVRLRRETQLSLPVAAAGTDAAVAAMSQALAGLSREIAAGLREVAGAPAAGLPRAEVERRRERADGGRRIVTEALLSFQSLAVRPRRPCNPLAVAASNRAEEDGHERDGSGSHG